MAELKKGFSQAKMNKDFDERLVPQGHYRDALNIQVATSDGSNVGSAQNLKGTDIRNQMSLTYDNQVLQLQDPNDPTSPRVSPSMFDNAVYGLPIFVPDGPVTNLSNPYLAGSGSILPANLGLSNLAVGRDDARWVGIGTCVGSIAVPDKDKIYYFVSAGSINKYPGFTVSTPTSGPDALTAAGIPRKDYIMEYDTITERLKYVFVDIYHVERLNTTTVGAVPGSAPSSWWFSIAEQPAGLAPTHPAAATTNISGIRIGMSISGVDTNTTFTATTSDNYYVTNIVHLPGLGWQVFANKPIAAAANDRMIFTAPRVLNFNEDIMITGINVIDDMLFWTDNNTEPKKINIPRSKAGTGGIEYIFTGHATSNPSHSNYGINSISGQNPLAIFDGDTDYFHTRLVTDKDNKGKLQIETTGTGKGHEKVVWVNEGHLTVIKKAPTQPLELDMSREAAPRFPTLPSGVLSTVANPSTATMSDLSIPPGTTNPFIDAAGNLLSPGDVISMASSGNQLRFDVPVDFREGDVILFTNSLAGQSHVNFEGFDVKVVITDDGGIDADNMMTDITAAKILSIRGGTNTLDSFGTFYARRQDRDPLFEYKFVRFSYRYKYVDGEYSNFAPWSQVAFLPDLYKYNPTKGFNLGMRNQVRNLKLTKYFTDPRIGAVPEDVVEIDLLYKETNNPTVYTVKTITPRDSNKIWPDFNDPANYLERGEFEIKTDLIHAVVPSNQLLRPWDNVPRKALGQEISANRLIYANYLQSYNVEDPEIELSLHQNSLEELGAEFAEPSVKTMRTYQIGVVYSDDYGRETPILTNKDASITVPKTASDTKNRIQAKLGLGTPLPTWAKYYSWYIKETTPEYYTMCMDRWYLAADGNIWISFPSAERNKVDEESFIILKKSHNRNVAVKERARYKVLAIENEAPTFIKTEKKILGTRSCPSTPSIFPNANFFPAIGQNEIHINANDFVTVFGDNLRNETSIWIYFTTGNQYSQEYEISNAADISQLNQTGGPTKLMLKRPFGNDIGFIVNDTTAPAPGNEVNGLQMVIVEREAEDRSEFDGKFFVKIAEDATLRTHVMDQTDSVGEWIPGQSEKIGYLNNNYAANASGVHNHNWYSYMRGGTGYTRPTAVAALDANNNSTGITSAPSRHPYNKNLGSPLTVAQGQANPYAHHGGFRNDGATTDNNGNPIGVYEWGSHLGATTQTTRIAGGVSADMLNTWGPNAGAQNQRISFNQGNGRTFWTWVAAQCFNQGFFIDACCAWSFTGGRDVGVNNVFPDQVVDSLQTDAWIVTGQNVGGSAWDKKDGAPNEVPVNVHDAKGQVSRGIWNNGEYMDISWSGMGPGYTNNFNKHGGFAHELKDVGTARHNEAAGFIERLVTPGTRFRFLKDPDNTIYKVEEWPGYDPAIHPHASPSGPVYRSPSANPTTQFTGVYGIRNYRTNFVANISQGDDKNQYEGENLRQRWTIRVEPRIGSGPSGYRPDKGTLDISQGWGGTQIPGLHHDFTNFDTIQIMEPRDSLDNFRDTAKPVPGVWETEPKESVDLDIYYQASGLIPLKLTEKTNEEYLPIGTTFYSPWAPGTTSSTKHTIISWDEDAFGDGQTIRFRPEIPAGIEYFKEAADIFFHKRDHYGIGGKVDTTTGNTTQFDANNNPIFGPGDDKITLHGFRQTGWHYNKMFRRYHILDWSNCWAFGNGVESDRIRDDFNAAQMDNGVKASSVLATPVEEERREHGLIWSGIYNSVSGVNDTNQFIQAEKITKDLNPIYGSIQKLYSRDTNLLTLCEDKVLNIAANKDALFNADGDSNVVATYKVLGAAKAYQGDYGISTNPESFAATPGALYFVDQMRGKVLSMFGDNHVRPISDIGMKDYFAKSLKSHTWGILGTYDESKSEYNTTIMYKYQRHMNVVDRATLSFSELMKGWTSFKSFQPENGISLNNDYYTFFGGELFKHHQDNVDYNRFYDIPHESTFTLTFNDQPESVKSFNAVNYEGTRARVEAFIETNATDAAGNSLVNINDNEYFNLTDKRGWYVTDITTNKQTGDVIEFKEKEGKWFGTVAGDTTTIDNLDQSEFSVQGLGNATFKYKEVSSPGNYGAPANWIVSNYPVEHDPLYGRIGNNIPGTGWDDPDPDDTFLNVTQPYTVWRPDPETQTFNTFIGDTIPAGVVEFELSPRAASQSLNPASGPLTGLAGTHFGYQLRAEDFSLGPHAAGTASLVPRNMSTTWSNDPSTVVQLFYHSWTPGNATTTATGPTGLGMPNVTKVVMYDMHPGSVDNKVKVEVHHDGWTQSSPTAYMHVDIDHVMPPEYRRAVMQTVYPYFRNQTTPVTKSIEDITGTLTQTGGANTSYIYTNNGKVINNTSTMISETTFTANDGFHYKSSPTVTMQNLVTGAYDYSKSYTTKIVPTYTNNKITSFKAQVFYTPPQDPLLLPDPVEFENLGHEAFVDYELQETSTVEFQDNSITNVVHDIELDRFPQMVLITVQGVAGTKYEIQVTQDTSTTNPAPVADKYYDFISSSFTTPSKDTKYTGTINADGFSYHGVSLPGASSQTSYSVVLNSIDGSTFANRVPTKPGDSTFIQYGTTKLTLSPVTYDNTGLVTVTETSGGEDNLVITKPERRPNEEHNIEPSFPITAHGGNGNSSNTIITLKTPTKGIKTGMYVVGLGAGTHKVTVSSVVRDKTIILSSAVAVTDETELTFYENKGDLMSFEFTLKPVSSKISLSLDYTDPDAGVQGRQPNESDIVGLSDVVVQTAADTSGSTSMKLDTTARLVPGMVLSSKETNKFNLDLKEINISSITDTDDVVLSSTVKIPNSSYIEFENLNNHIKVIDIQAVKDGSDVKIQGLLSVPYVNTVYLYGVAQETATAYINLDNFIKFNKGLIS